MFAGAGHVFAATGGYPNGAGCGIGSFVLVRAGMQQLRHTHPMFIDMEPDHDGRLEGRSDTFYMVRHEVCIDTMQAFWH